MWRHTPRRWEIGPNVNELVSKIDRVKNAISYLFQYATDEMMAQGIWHSLPSSKTFCIIANLLSGVKYNFRVAALGPREQLLYSEIVSRKAA